jgi:hypothetical protein
MSAVVLLPFSQDPQLTGIQVGDTAYYVDTSNITTTGSFSTTSSLNDIIEIGVVSGFSGTYNIEVTVTNAITLPTTNDYIFFSKDNSVNLASLKGYFAEIKFVNDSIERAELFSIAVNVEESSK